MIKTLLLSLIISTSAFALEVVDPGHHLDFISGAKTFTDAFTCPSSAYVYGETAICSVNCTTSYCMSQCRPVKGKSSVFVDSCSPEHLAIYSDQGLEFNVTAQAYQLNKLNWVRTFIEQTPQFFSTTPTKVTVSFFMPKSMTFVHDGQMEKIFGSMLLLDYQFQPGTMPMSLELYVNPRGRGLDQILKLGKGKDVLYQRKGFFDDQMP